MKIYITGIKGMLGSACEKILKEKYKISGCDIIDNEYSKIDICNYEKLIKDIEKVKPDIILHTAAMINIEDCEKNKDKCKKINIDATENITKICDKNKIKMIFISTPSVFDGTKEESYNEEDLPCPVNFYGESKVEGENIIKQLDKYLIIRTNIIGFTQTKKSFLEWTINSLLKEKETKMFEDFYSNYIFTEDLARCIDKLIEKKVIGIYNVSTEEIISKYDFGLKVCENFGYRNNIKPVKMNEVLSVPRGNNLKLDLSKVKKIINLPTFKETLRNARDSMKFYN